jgi:hypothetical protein
MPPVAVDISVDMSAILCYHESYVDSISGDGTAAAKEYEGMCTIAELTGWVWQDMRHHFAHTLDTCSCSTVLWQSLPIDLFSPAIQTPHRSTSSEEPVPRWHRIGLRRKDPP